ncbi:MAG TPA: hypothetical protein VGS04_01815 [Nitrososphaerales archaeon]|nr:hypothetical protein [Nitrososphaerales archaeon]
MKRQNVINSALVAAVALLLTSGGSAFAAGNTPQLSMSVSGQVLYAGNQHYQVNGAQLVYAMIDGQQIDPTTAKLQYQLGVNVNGLQVSGNAQIDLTGYILGTSTKVTAQGPITVQSIPNPIYIPLGCAPPACTSAIPTFFQGSSNFQVTMGNNHPMTQPETFEMESPYFNPFGAPIVVASTDGAVFIVATYSQGTIQWQNSVVGGQITGTFGTNPVRGNFTLTSSENENLVTGTAQDGGHMSFTGMTDPNLNQNGNFAGTSTIPTAGAFDCSSILGTPAGTCTATGFNSVGTFSMNTGPQYNIAGTYQTTWGVPALGFTSSISATTSTH